MDLFGKEYTLDQTYIRVGNVNKKYGGADAYWVCVLLYFLLRFC